MKRETSQWSAVVPPLTCVLVRWSWVLLVLLALSSAASLLQAGCSCPQAVVTQGHVLTLCVDIGKNKPGFICHPFAKRMLCVAPSIPPSFNYMLACMTSVASSSQKPSGGTERFCFWYFFNWIGWRCQEDFFSPATLIPAVETFAASVEM